MNDLLKDIILSFYTFLLFDLIFYLGISSSVTAIPALICLLYVSIYFGDRFSDKYDSLNALARASVITFISFIVSAFLQFPYLTEHEIVPTLMVFALIAFFCGIGIIENRIVKQRFGRNSSEIRSLFSLELVSVLASLFILFTLVEYQFFTILIIDRLPSSVYYAFADVHNYFGGLSYGYNTIYQCSNKTIYVVNGGYRDGGGIDYYFDKNGTLLCKVVWSVEIRQGFDKAFENCPVTSDCNVLAGDPGLSPHK